MVFRIPIKPYLKKFVLKRMLEPYKATNKDYIGIFLLKLLRDKQRDTKFDNWRDNYIQRIHVELPDHSVFRKCSKNINGLAIMKFNGFLRDLFFEKLFDFIHYRMLYANHSVKVAQAIREFSEYYDLSEEDIPYMTMRRNYHRLYNEYKKKNVDNPRTFSSQFTTNKIACA